MEYQSEIEFQNEYQSEIEFQNIFSNIDETTPIKIHQSCTILKTSLINTKLGPMVAIADDVNLYLLDFMDKKDLKGNIEKLKIKTNGVITKGITDPINSIRYELSAYFDGKLKKFKTPLGFLGSSFQNLTWKELMNIPYGQTCNYRNQAMKIGHNKAYRAVGNANGANQLVIIVPCHRTINSNGCLGGYSGGIERKKWLMEHEKKNA